MLMNDVKNKKSYTFNILHEGVSGSDLFEDKTHEGVTETLLKLIESSDKGITVGLEGGWGSGKSTVVELLKNKIEEKHDKNTLFFLFDAWAHEGDPLRRIFLESLIKEIDPEEKDAYLLTLREEISCRTKTVKVRSEKKASKLGKWLALFAMFVPAGAAMLTAVDYGQLYFPWESNAYGVASLLLIGLLMSFAPLLVIPFWWRCGEKDNNGKVKWGFLESDSTENYTQDITEDGERTSIEFERFFEKILEYSLGDDKRYQRAIIVIDNLDRVSANHAIAIWSTLQTFFQHRSRSSNIMPNWMRCLWFLVPFDREGLSKIWKSDSSDGSSSNAHDLSKSFYSKSFQVIAEVPTPVMSAWYKYCVTCVNKSLEEWPDNDKEKVINTYQRYGSRLDISPTPREIQNFVNQVGLIGMRWGGIMDAESISIYAVLRQNHTETGLRKQLLNSGLPDGFEVRSDAENIKMELSGMLFGVMKERGIQLLIAPEIQSAMTNGDGATINGLIEDHDEAFWIVWEAIKNETVITSSHTEEYRIAATQAIHGGMLRHKNRIQPEIRSLEQVWYATADRWDLNEHDYSGVIPLMAELLGDSSKFIDWCYETTKKKLSVLVSEAKDQTIEVEELSQINNLSVFLKNRNKPIKRLFYNSLGVAEWKYWLTVSDKANITLKFVLPKKGVISELSNVMLPNQNTLAPEGLEVLIGTVNIWPLSDEWADVVSKLISWGNAPGHEVGNNLAYWLMLKIVATCKNDVSAPLRKCIKEATFWQRGAQETIESAKNLPLLSAYVFGLELQSTTQVSDIVKQFWQSEDLGEEYIDEIIEHLSAVQKLSTIWVLAQDVKNKLAIEIIKSNTDNTELYSVPNAFLNLNNYSWIDKGTSDVIASLCDTSDISYVREEIKADPLKYAKSLYLVLSYGNSDSIAFVERVINSLSAEQWQKSLQDNSYTLDCVLHKNIKPDHRYTDAFNKYFKNAVHEDTTDEWVWEHFDVLLNKTLDTESLLRKLAEKYFESADDNINDIGFEAISSHMSQYISSIDHVQVMERVGFWLNQSKWDRLKWFVETGYMSDGEPSETLSSRVNHHLQSCEDEEKNSVLQRIVNIFKVKITSDDDNDNSSEEDKE